MTDISTSPLTFPEEVLTEIIAIHMEKYRKDPSLPILPLLLANKQLSTIAIPLLYSKVIIRRKKMSRFLRSITRSFADRTRHLVLYLDAERIRWGYRTLVDGLLNCRRRLGLMESEDFLVVDKLTFAGPGIGSSLCAAFHTLFSAKHLEYRSNLIRMSSIFPGRPYILNPTDTITFTIMLRSEYFHEELDALAVNCPRRMWLNLREDGQQNVVSNGEEENQSVDSSSDDEDEDDEDVASTGQLVLNIGYLSQELADTVVEEAERAVTEAGSEWVTVVCEWDEELVQEWNDASLLNRPRAQLPDSEVVSSPE